MTFNYARSVKTANRLITRFGQTGTLRRPSTSGTAYNPTEGTPTDYDALFVVTEYRAEEIDGTRVLSTDKRAYIAKGDLTVEPETSDLLIETDGSEFKIVSVRPMKSGQMVVFWELQVRR